MKEATGELNMTVITVVAIAAVGLIFTLFVWPNIQASLMMSTACSNVDMNGDYKSEEVKAKDAKDNGEGTVECANWVCTATYNNKTYKRTCGNDTNPGGA